MKKILALIFLAIFCVPAVAYPNVIKERPRLSEFEQREVRDVARKTSMTEDEIRRYIERGLSTNDIFVCYTAWQFVNKDMPDIAKTFIDEGKDVDLLLKDYEIDKAEFEEKFETLFPKDEDMVRRANVPWLQAPQR